VAAQAALASLWQLAGLPRDALAWARLTGADPVYPSSFAVATAAQASVAAAALAACELGHARGAERQFVQVDAVHAAAECLGWFSIDGRVPEPRDRFPALPRPRRLVRLHANFVHRRGRLRLLGLDPPLRSARAERALQGWDAISFEDAAASRPGAGVRIREWVRASRDWRSPPSPSSPSALDNAPPRWLPCWPPDSGHWTVHVYLTASRPARGPGAVPTAPT
jgi:hypothetical protein